MSSDVLELALHRSCLVFNRDNTTLLSRHVYDYCGPEPCCSVLVLLFTIEVDFFAQLGFSLVAGMAVPIIDIRPSLACGDISTVG